MPKTITILVVEDSALMRRVTREMLRTLGNFDIVEATDGGAAIAVLEGRSVDIVLSDRAMHPVDGFHLLQAMKARPTMADIPFIMMTAEENPQIITQAVAVGVAYFLTKPFDRDQLGKMLQRVLATTTQAA